MKEYSLYRHFDREGKLLYVGISMAIFRRFVQHHKNSLWSENIVSMTIEKFSSKADVLIAEKNAIEKESPLHNIIYNKQRTTKVSKFKKTIGTLKQSEEKRIANEEAKAEAEIVDELFSDIWQRTGWDLIGDNVYQHRRTGEVIHHKQISW